MKQSFIALFTTLFFSITVVSQEKIDFNYKRDFDKILEATEHDDSQISFKKLFPRFAVADTTLTNYEILALQIAYTENENYLPYQDIELEREIWSLNEEGKFEEAIKKCDILLKNNPFNLIANREKGYALSKTNKETEAENFNTKFYLIVSCDLSTGTGTTYENSFFVLSPADGQWIIKLALQSEICKMGSGRDKNNLFHDILGIKINEREECIDLFFNIEHATKRMLIEK